MREPSKSRYGVPLLAAGQILAERFRIVDRLGEGAIGEVYEASDLELEEQVAIKVLRPEIARDPEVLHRFKREILLARRVTHPGVCRTFDLFHHRWDDGSELAFVTMELLRGETLEERLLRDGRMSVDQAMPLVAQIADGLQAAHQAGVVHRDFKTGNVMLVPGPGGPRAVVTDFGLAWSSSMAASVTQAGSMVGSPAYMAPEQVRGEAVTPATDIYAFGIVLYEIVTGNLPFSADTAFGTAIKRLREPPTLPRVHAPDLEPLWEDVILRCLESDPADRFPTPFAVAQALAAPAPARVSGAAALRRLRRFRRVRWGTLAIGAIAVAAGLGAVFLAWSMREAPRPAAAGPAAAGTSRPAVAVFGFENLSRDSELAYVERSLVRLLPFELAAGERLRLIPGEQVILARRDFSLAAGAELSPETLKRVRDRLGADFVIAGSYFGERRGGRGAGRLRCDVTIQDARSGEIVASLSQNGTEEDLLDLVDGLGAQLRRSLGVEALSLAEERAMRTARPASAQAARLYAEGMEKLSRYETLAATALLEQARDADPENALIRAELATAWRALGWQTRAEEAAKEAFQRSGGLGYEPRRRVEARYYETTRQWDLAAGIYRELRERFPDDLEYGLGLERAQLQMGNAQAALETLTRLRAADEPWSGDPRIDLATAEASLSLGDFADSIETAARAQRKGEALGAPILAARGLHFQGVGLRSLGRLPEARTAGERASGLFRKAGDLASAAAALITVGNVQTQQGDLEGARRTFEEIAAIGQAIGNEETRGTGLSNLGVILSERGDLAGAREHYEQALEIFRRLGSKRRAAAIAVNLARIDQRLGHRAQARALLVEMAATLRELGDRSNEAAVLASLAVLSVEEGNLSEASDLAARALAIHQEIGEISGVAVDRAAQGQVLALRGDLPAARRELEAAAASLDEQGETMEAARQRIELARVLVAAGDGKTGEAMARRALEGLGAKPAPDDEVAARAALAAALLGQGRPADAAAALEQASPSLAACENPARRLQASLVAARVHAAQGKSRQAAGELHATLAEAESSGLRPLASEAQLLLHTIEAGRLSSRRGPA